MTMKASIIFALIAGTALAMPALDTRAIKQRDDPDEDHEDLCDDLTEQLDTARYYALEVQKSPSTYGQDAVESVNAKVKKALEAFQEAGCKDEPDDDADVQVVDEGDDE